MNEKFLNEDGQLLVGTKIRFTGVKPEITKEFGKTELIDVTLGKVYTIEGHGFDGQAYFIDDAGDEDYAAEALYGDGVYEIVTE